MICYFIKPEAGIAAEIEFGMKHFDAVEVSFIPKLKHNFKILRKAKIIGHSNEYTTIMSESISKELDLFNKVDVLYYGAHCDDDTTPELLRERIEELEDEFSIKILLENSKKGLYSSPSEILKASKYLLWDVGHSIIGDSYESFLENKEFINHIHLHDVVNGRDHVEVVNERLIEMALSIKANISLEIFYKAVEGLPVRFDGKERRGYLLKLKHRIEGFR